MSKPDKASDARKPTGQKIQLNKETLKDIKPTDQNVDKIKAGQGTAAASRRPC